MKRLSYLLACILVGTLGLATVAQAHETGHQRFYDRGHAQDRFEKRIDRRQARQWARVNKGIDSGAISRGEAKRLFKKQRKIARLEHRFERDGYYSPREKRIMERALDRSSDLIRRAKHNDRDRQYRGHDHGWRHGLERYRIGDYAHVRPEETYGFSFNWIVSD